MPYIGNQPYQGVIDSGNIVDGSIQTGDLANSAVTAAKIADTGVTVAKLNSDVTQLIAQGGGPKITGVAITNSSWTVLDDTAVDTAGGYVKLTGTNFVTGCSVVVGTTSATAVTFTSSTELRVQLPAQAAGTYILYVTNPDGGTAIRVNAVTYSATPSWVTSSTLPQQDDGVAISIQLSATSATTYALQAGSTLPSGLTLSSGGLLSGTVSGLASDTSYSFTVVATDAELQDSPRAFTVNIAASDTYFNLTTLLINGDTAPNVLTDASSNNFNLTAYGDSRASNFTPYATGWSVYFDGSSGIYAASNTASQFGTNAFTIEAFVYMTSYSTYSYIIDTRTAGTNGLWLYYYNGAFTTGQTADLAFSNSSISLNTWNHIAFTGTGGNTLELFINGVSKGTITHSYNVTGDKTTIGRRYNPAEAANNWNGYISNVRVTKGVRLYTANFTPETTNLTTSPATLGSGTVSLLTCLNNRLLDLSSTNYTSWTRDGTPRVTTFNPFNITNTGVDGSMYFDGSGDYVQANGANLAVGTGDFTFECWVYTWVLTGDPGIMQIGPSAYATNTPGYTNSIGMSITNGNIFFYNNGTYTTGNVSIQAYTWNHLAVCRSGTTHRLFVNGVQAGSVTDSSNYTGQFFGAGVGYGTNFPFTGYITNIRLLRGTALYTTAFTPSTIPLTAVTNTQLLTLQHKQPHNNHGFQDSSTNNHLITRSGNVTQGTFSPFSQTGWGNYFNGTNAYLNAGTSLFNYTTGNASTTTFTIEAMIYLNAYESATDIWRLPCIIGKGDVYLAFSVNASGNLIFYHYDGTGRTITGSSVIPLATWTYVAVTVTGGTATVYVNGTSNGSGTWYGIATAGQNTDSLIGRSANNVNSKYFNGYISNLRVSTVARTIATPTAPYTNDANTALLTAQSNRFVDNSSSPITLSISGSPTVVAFSPFNPSASWSAATYGGSGYFDGSGDYLGFPVSSAFTLGTNDFTIEGWLYPNTLVSGVSTAFVLDSNAYPRVMWYYVGGVFTVHVSTTGAGWDITQTCSVLVNQWNHLVLQRNGNDFRTFLNGSLAATTTASLNIPAQRSVGYVGRGDGGSQIWNGYVSGLRVVNGTAVYNTSGFTPPTSPPTAITNTSLLLNFTNAGIYDATSKNDLETVGDAQISNTTAKWGSTSIKFDGTGDYLAIPTSQQLNLSSGNWTVECWVNAQATGFSGLLSWRNTGATSLEPDLYVWNTGVIVWYFNSAAQITGTTNIVGAGWVHVAVAKSGSSTRLFVNGNQEGSTLTDNNTYLAPNTTLKIGAQLSASQWLNGYMQDVRITKGYARYITNFTPPAQKFKLR